MKAQLYQTITFSLITSLMVGNALSEELFPYKGIQASIANDYQCQPSVSVRLEVKTEDQIRQSRIDMQELSGMVKTYLRLDCEKIESITYEGFVKGSDKRIYQAVAKKQDKWYLDEKAPKNNDQNSKTKKEVAKQPIPSQAQQKQQAQKKKGKPATLEELEKSSAGGSVEAMIELAKGLLGLSSADPKVKFQKDSKRGMELLEKLASNGNLDAKHLLGEAYQSNDQLSMNFPLLEKITTDLPENASQQRGQVAAQLTIESAAKGSKEAIVALKEAGEAGSALSYYALGMMYILDELKQMPVDADFIQEDLKLDSSNPDNSGFGNADVGLHFLTLAAEKGNTEAQGLLKDMDIDFDAQGSSQALINTPSQNTSAKGASGQTPPASSAASSNMLAQGIESLESEKLYDALQTGSASASQTQTNSSGVAINSQQQGGLSSKKNPSQARSGSPDPNDPQGSGAGRLKKRTPPSVGSTPTGTESNYSPNKPTKMKNSTGYSSEANQDTEEKQVEILD